MSGPAVEDIWVPLRRRLSRVHGRNREVDRFLATMDYRPTDAEAPTGAHDVIICGSPRSGTTLLAAQLFQPPAVVSVMEPWDGLRMAPAELFRSLRAELATGTLRRGKLDVAALRAHRRVDWIAEGDAVAVGPVDDDAVVAVKWPSWWQYLDRLPATRFLVCLRHPGEVVDSFRRIGGRLREGQDHPVPLNVDLNERVREQAGRHLAHRRETLYELVNQSIVEHLGRPNVFVVRFERWFTDPDGLRRDLSAFLDRDLGPWPAEVRAPAEPAGSVPTPPSLVDIAHALGYR